MAVPQVRVQQQLQLLAAEFSAPLQYLSSATEFLQAYADELPSVVVQHIAEMQLTSRRLLKLTDLVLLHERVMGGQTELLTEPVNVAALAQESFSTSLALHDQQNFQEPVIVTSYAWPAQCDRRVLRAVLEALSDVLVMTSHQPSRVAARLVRRSDEVHLELTDDGPIVSRRELKAPAIFGGQSQPFSEFTAHQALSVTIVKDLLQAMRGSVSMARTEAGRRHTVVRLPMTHQLGLPV